MLYLFTMNSFEVFIKLKNISYNLYTLVHTVSCYIFRSKHLHYSHNVVVRVVMNVNIRKIRVRLEEYITSRLRIITKKH